MGIPSVVPGSDLVESTCNMMFSTADLMTSGLLETAHFFKAQIDSIIAFLSSLSWTPRSEFLRIMSQVTGEADNYLPNLQDADKLTRIINACNFLNDSILGSPSTLMNSIYDDALSCFDDTILALAAMLPEILAAKFIDRVMRMIKIAKFPDALDRSKKALKCLEEVCGRDVTVFWDRIIDALNILAMDGTGEFSIIELMRRSGDTDPDHVSDMNSAYENYKILNAKYETTYRKVIKDIKVTLDWNDPLDPLPPPLPDAVQDPFA